MDQTISGNLASLTTADPEVVYDSVANYIRARKLCITVSGHWCFYLQHYCNAKYLVGPYCVLTYEKLNTKTAFILNTFEDATTIKTNILRGK